MQPRFNINRPPVSDEEIEKHKDFDSLVEQFKKQSLKKARGDESWWKNKKVQYSTIILGITVVCTVTYQSLSPSQKTQAAKHEKINTLQSYKKPVTRPTATSAAPYVKPTVPKVSKKPATYKVNNQKGAVINHPGSTKITVPRNSFVNREGHEIEGEITLEYREFDDIADIVAAGIPMRHDSTGQRYDLESAGMFEVKAQQNGKPVFINPGKPLRVELATRSAEPRFHQYYLDTLARNWRFLGEDQLLAVQAKNTLDNRKIKRLEYETETMLPAKIDSTDRSYATLSKSFVQPRKPVMPNRATAGRPSFVLESDQNEFPELSVFKNVIFEVGPENKHFSSQLHNITWSNINITAGPVKGKNYVLHLSYRDQREELIVYPVLDGNDFDVARSQYQTLLANYEIELQRKKEREEKLKAQYEAEKLRLKMELAQKEEALRAARRENYTRTENNSDRENFTELNTQGKVKRIFEVSKFGIYNSDCPHLATGTEKISPGFVGKKKEKPVRPELVYLIDHTMKTVVVSDRKDPFLALRNENDYSLCVVESGKMYTCDKVAFKAVRSEDKTIFPLEENSEAASSIEGLRKALGI